MGLSLDRALKLERQLTSELQNMLDNTERFYWSHSFYLEAKSKWMADKPYQSAPRWLVERLAGFEAARLALIWRNMVVFSYEHNGARYTFDNPEYRKIPPRDIDTNTGAYVWKGDSRKFFTEPGAHVAKATCQV